ncbi:MAG: cation transporter [Ruminococcaceae bacterium]|nr:cation transporter [Oscillospiraceae bacterium]
MWCYLMKTDRNILIAFFLNLFFSILEIFAGLFTGSIAILSDSVHDFGDSVSIGLAYMLEKKSRRHPDEMYTYGYTRYSVLGAAITNTILIISSVMIAVNSIMRIMHPEKIQYNGMILFAAFGVIINFIAAFFTKGGKSLNEKAVGLHMLEDVLCWGIILIGAVVIKFTDITMIDALLSIGLAIFIFINALRGFKKILDLFLEKTPGGISVPKLRSQLMAINGVTDIYHIHVRSVDGVINSATMHVVTTRTDHVILKKELRRVLEENGIGHATLELEDGGVRTKNT